MLEAVQDLLKLEQEVLDLCTRQLGNSAFFTGIALQNRSAVHAELQKFIAQSRQHKQALENIAGSILPGGPDVY